MKIKEMYRLLITTLSPVHISTGDSYQPTNYVISDGMLYEFDTGVVVDTLSSADRKQLLDISNQRPDHEMIKRVQQFFFERRRSLMERAVNYIPVLPGVAKLYAERIGQAASHEASGSQVVNKLEIDRTGYDVITHRPILYGSSLKGAIRTALLDKINNNAGLKKVKDGRTGEMRDENNMELQQRLFRYRPGKFELDPMRLVHLADAIWSGNGLHPAQVYLAVNRKKAAVRDTSGKLIKSQAESRGLYQLLECIPAWRYRTFTGQLNMQSVAGLDDKYTDKMPFKDLRFSINDIAKACNAFYTPILEKEIELMREGGYLDASWGKSIEKLMQKSTEKRQRAEVFLLRVGRHSGAESVTLNGVRKIKIMKGKGQRPDYDYDKEARTWWLAAVNKDQEKGFLPFGWLFVEVFPITAEPQEWQEIKEICEPYQVEARTIAAVLKNNQIPRLRTKAEPANTKTAQSTALGLETLVWDNASLDWNAGNGMLTATFQGKKAHIKLLENRDIVPSDLYQKLFVRKQMVTAKVIVEKDGNLLRIVKIEK